MGRTASASASCCCSTTSRAPSTTAVGLIEAYRSGQDLSRLGALFDEWERWAAGVMETHTSYRMLVLFRSRRTGQSWLTALAVLAETSATVLACLPGRPAARGAALLPPLDGAAGRPHEVDTRPGGSSRWLAPYELDDFRESYDHLAGLGFELRPFDEAWPAMQALRDGYVGPLATLFHLLLPRRRFLNPEVRYPDLLERLRRQIERGERGERGEEGG